MTEPQGDRLPLFPLGTVLFPGMLLPLHLFEERYRRLMHDRQGTDPIFGVVLTSQGREVGDRPEIHAVGTAASLLGAGRYADGRYDVVVRGTRRFRVEGGDWERGYLTGTIAWLDDPIGSARNGPDLANLAEHVVRAYEQFLAAVERAAGAEVPRQKLADDPRDLAYAICARLPLNTWERQRLLEEATTRGRLARLLVLLRRERDLLQETGAGGAVVEHPGTRFSPN